MTKPYPSYKDSGVEWIGEIPSHWTKKNLKYSFNIEKGKVPKEIVEEPNDTSLPYLSMDVLRGHTAPQYCDISDGVRVEDKDLLILWDGSKSGEILYGIDGVLSSTMSKMTLIDSNLKNPFCYYLLKHYERDFQNNTVGMGIPHMNGDYLRFSKLVIPPLAEQKQIVSFLDHKTRLIDELTEKTEQKIELLKEKRTFVINHCVTKGLNPNVEMKDSGVEGIGKIPNHWDVRRIAAFGIFSKGRGIRRDEIKTSGIPCIRYGEIYTEYDRIVYDTISFIDEESGKNSKLVKKGNVLFTGSGETIEEIGKTVVYYGDDDIFVGGDVIILKLKDNLNPLFISYMMNSNYVNHQKSRMGKGEIVVHIYSKQLKEIETSLPPLPEQQQIVEYLDEQTRKIGTTIQKETQRIELLKEYRQSLISEVVTGKIDVREEMVV